jgi:hypothetical protein
MKLPANSPSLSEIQDRSRFSSVTIRSTVKPMKHPIVLAGFSAVALAVGCIKLTAEPILKKPSENKVYAQTLINEIIRDNPDILITSLHAIAPGANDQTMIASTLDRIGEKDDDEDLTVVKEHEIILAQSQIDPNKFKTHMAMMDASGKFFGELVVIFKYDSGKNEAYYCSRAVNIRAGLAKKIANFAVLFNPTN